MTPKNENETRRRVLITAPSLDVSKNVSGISTLVREIRRSCDHDFVHFNAGRRDDEKGGPFWILKQIILPVRFVKFLFSRKPDIVHINTAMVPLSIFRDTVLTIVASLLGYPVLLHLHGGRYLMEDFESRFLKFLTKLMLRFASVVVVLSELEEQNMERHWPDIDVHILPNAIDTARLIDADRKGDGKSLIYLGRIHESKGLSEIVQACRVIKEEGYDIQFNCYGSGPQKELFINEMNEVLNDSFAYGGVIAGPEIWEALARSDIFVLPSRYGEGLPISMLEAMAAGCVVIVGDVASVSSVVNDGVNGFVVEPYNVEQIVEKLRFVLSGEANSKKIGANAYETIRAHFNIEDYVKKLKRLYNEISKK